MDACVGLLSAQKVSVARKWRYASARGHVCMVGDPACAKSQLLRAIAKIVPRSVMATWQSSSAAGLTAAVVRVCVVYVVW
jgi:DNA replicative helicase MCM subunit Mcm2 (Cdc46/Mcm family)